MHRSRRTASPVRVVLAGEPGGNIDGAWWPRSYSISRELPELMQALHPSLGDIVDIEINWSATSPTPSLSEMSAAATTGDAGPRPRHRLMFLTGQSALTKILVVPSMTPAPLALMVLRHAAQQPIPDAVRDTKEFRAAQNILRSACTDSENWASELSDALKRH